MFSKIINWIKQNKIVSVVIVVLLFLLLRKSLVSGGMRGISRVSPINSIESVGFAPMFGLDVGLSKNASLTQADSQARKIITNSNFSLLVKKVNETLDNIKKEADQMGGYVTGTVINRDEKADKATIEVRVPSDKLEEFSKYLRSIAVKVVYENIIGHDITDQYTDYAKRLESLESARSKLEAIINRAVTADEILNVQTRIFEIQDQIDAIKGQMSYMDKASETSKVSIVLSTDELALPYTPVKVWRPDVVFKQAVRALLGALMAVGSVGIWVVVFSPLAVLAFVLKKLFVKFFKKKS